MNEFYLSRKISARLSLRAAVRMFCILTLALWGPAMAGAQAQTQPLDVANTSITDKLTLTYKLKSNSSTEYAWFYKVGTNGTETEFSGTLTGTNANWQQGAIDIKSEKEIGDTDKDNLDSYPILKLDGLNLTSTTADGSLFSLEGSKPLCIQATGGSSSNLRAKKHVIKNYKGCILLLDGGTAELNIAAEGTGSYGIFLYSTGSAINTTLKGKINVTAEDIAVFVGNLGAFSATGDAEVTVSSGDEDAIYESYRVLSPFLQWKFATAPEAGKTLEIRDAGGMPFATPITFATDGQKKGFAINVAKNTGYTLWLDGKQLMDKDEKPSLRRRTINYSPSREWLFLPTGTTTARQPMSALMATISPSPAQTTPSRPPADSRGSPG